VTVVDARKLTSRACRQEPEYNLTMYNYGGPRVGNEEFVELYKVKDSWRIHNENDIVAQIPIAGVPHGFARVSTKYQQNTCHKSKTL
jgi:predicted lipase